MKYFELSCRLLAALMVTALSSDLLYLYFNGCWYDPIKWIEITEVVLLFILTGFGIAQFIQEVIKQCVSRNY